MLLQLYGKYKFIQSVSVSDLHNRQGRIVKILYVVAIFSGDDFWVLSSDLRPINRHTTRSHFRICIRLYQRYLICLLYNCLRLLFVSLPKYLFSSLHVCSSCNSHYACLGVHATTANSTLSAMFTLLFLPIRQSKLMRASHCALILGFLFPGGLQGWWFPGLTFTFRKGIDCTESAGFFGSAHVSFTPVCETIPVVASMIWCHVVIPHLKRV